MRRLAFLFLISLQLFAATVSPLYQRGYAVLPEPQKVTLGPGDFPFGPEWRLETSPGIQENDIAIQTLREDLDSRFHLKLSGQRSGAGVLHLTIANDSVAVGASQDRDKKAIAAQAYRIDLAPGRITITANAPVGLFYGAGTLVQLLKPRGSSLWLPEGRIEDWPDLQLRQIYWD